MTALTYDRINLPAGAVRHFPHYYQFNFAKKGVKCLLSEAMTGNNKKKGNAYG